jgi:dTDP-4-amino-4,6-dideoxygalactose transaminase
MSRPRIPWWRTDLGDAEIEAVTRAIRERHIHHGPVCRQLEAGLAEVLQVSHVTVTTSGSVALMLSLLACGVGPGDEVVIPASTFVAPAHAALLLGARVKLVDVCADRPLLDPNRLEAVLTAHTKAIIAAHLDGRACEIEAIRAVAAKAGVRVIEDAAQALFSRGPHGWLGTAADAGTFSMGITKLMTTGEGGFIVTNDEEMNDRLTKLRNHGVIAIADNVFDGLGGNFRLTDLQAAVGLAQLGRLQAKAEAVRRVYRFYAEALAGLSYIELLEVRVDEGELPLWVEVLCAERDKVVSLLAQRGIESKAFHPCLAASPHLASAGNYPNAERFAKLGLTLPSGPDQSEEDLRRVVAALREIGDEMAGCRVDG